MTTCRTEGPEVLLGSRVMRAVADRLRLLAAQPFHPVFITGPVGAGKTHAARMLHRMTCGARPSAPFVDLHVEASGEQFGQQLFGQDAAGTREPLERAAVVEAAGGTLLLEGLIGLRPRIETRLVQLVRPDRARDLESGRADETPRFRLVLASTHSLCAMVDANRLSSALATEIGTAVVAIPPLAAHRDDIPLLATAFADRFSAEQGSRRVLSRAALGKLMDYRLPGNIRELRNIIRRAVIVAGTVEISADDIILPT